MLSFVGACLVLAGTALGTHGVLRIAPELRAWMEPERAGGVLEMMGDMPVGARTLRYRAVYALLMGSAALVVCGMTVLVQRRREMDARGIGEKGLSVHRRYFFNALSAEVFLLLLYTPVCFVHSGQLAASPGPNPFNIVLLTAMIALTSLIPLSVFAAATRRAAS